MHRVGALPRAKGEAVEIRAIEKLDGVGRRDDILCCDELCETKSETNQDVREFHGCIIHRLPHNRCSADETGF
jgi:hypothetical protein